MGAVSVVSVRSSTGLTSPSPSSSAPSLAPQHLSRREKLKDFVPASVGRGAAGGLAGAFLSAAALRLAGRHLLRGWEPRSRCGRLGVCRTVCRWIMRRDEGGKPALPFSGSDTKGQRKKLNEQGWRGGQGGDKGRR